MHSLRAFLLKQNWRIRTEWSLSSPPQTGKIKKLITPTSQEVGGGKELLVLKSIRANYMLGFHLPGTPIVSPPAALGFSLDCASQASELTALVTMSSIFLPSCKHRCSPRQPVSPFPPLAPLLPCTLHLPFGNSGSRDAEDSPLPYGTEFRFILFLFPISRYSGRQFYDDTHS